jgi:hypothetical protein
MTITEEFAKQSVSFDRKLVKTPLPKEVTLYAINSDHFILSTHDSSTLDGQALVKTRVNVDSEDGTYVVRLPASVYRFYQLDENDYTVMVSEKDPTHIIVAL